jgi:hypothetical protein
VLRSPHRLRTCAAADRTKLTDIEAGSSDSLTRAMVLHPIACGEAFIAWLLSIGGAVVGSLFGVLAAFVAWVLCLIVLKAKKENICHPNPNPSIFERIYHVWFWKAFNGRRQELCKE